MKGTVKGTRDILSTEAWKRSKIKEILERNFQLYGFAPIETPTIEYLEVVQGDNKQDEAVSDIFKLQDRGKRNLALRYEFTFQLARLFKENPNLKLPFRRYQIGNVFRDEPVTQERFREFTQCDIDIIGDSSAKADAEILAVVNSVFKELGIKIKIVINNRKLLDDVLQRLKINESDKDQILREIDKLAKLGNLEVEKNLSGIIGKSKARKILELIKKPLTYFLKEKYEGVEEVRELISVCKNYGFKTDFQASLTRGLSYYTGNVFEIFSEDLKSSLAGGGRYDKTVGKYIGRELPATGIAFGLDRLTGLAKVEIKEIRCIIVSIKQDKEAIDLAKVLREKGISCIVMYNLSKALKYANSQNIPYTIIIGQQEQKAKKVKIKDMKSGKEMVVSVKNIQDLLK